MNAKMSAMSTPMASIRCHPTGAWAKPTRAMSSHPDSRMATTATATSRKKRPSAKAMSGSRAGGSRTCMAAGRKAKWAKTMPPSQTTALAR